MIIGIMGNARAGKDTLALHLVRKYGFTRVGLADPLKRFCGEVFDFTPEQLYGDKRDAPDFRYPRPAVVAEVSAAVVHELSRAGDTRRMFMTEEQVLADEASATAAESKVRFLTPRFALQTLGTEWGRTCYPNIWIETGIRVAKTLLSDHAMAYAPAVGLYTKTPWKPEDRNKGVVFSDLRFKNEFDAMKKAGAKLFRIFRPGEDGTKLAGVKLHPSEEEQRSIPDSEFDVIIQNDGTLVEYLQKIDIAMDILAIDRL